VVINNPRDTIANVHATLGFVLVVGCSNLEKRVIS
jgi:hypothetical protein